MAHSTDVAWITGGAELLDRISTLWHELRIHHAGISATWRESLLASNFDNRKAELIRKGAKGLLVLLAVADQQPVGYCVSSIAQDDTGEIDSIFVRDSHRRRGIAQRMMTDSMQWLSGQNVKTIIVDVLFGNDEAVHLYEKFGFHRRTTRMRYIPGSQAQ